MDKQRIGQDLVAADVITSAQLELGLRAQEKEGGFICETLVRMGAAAEEVVFERLARRLSVPYARLKDIKIDEALIRKVPARLASHYKIIPLKMRGQVLELATRDPQDIRKLDDIRLLLGSQVDGVLAYGPGIEAAVRAYYGIGAGTLEKMIGEWGPEIQKIPTGNGRIEDLEASADDASIVKFVNQVLMEAVTHRATDIHLEPFHQDLRTRFRIDGVLYSMPISDNVRHFHPAILSRIKVMADLNIAERRMPQDGRIRVKVEGRELDLRVSTMPTVFGEAAHLRILSARQLLDLEKLGFAAKDLELLEGVIHKPHGVVFVTGPTGSGKSTTLYASLARINTDEIKIITVEDPVEYQMNGVNQVQIQGKINFDFATGLRHILRHDPDVIMIGEVRDSETAEIAIRAALTGHLVFSTLHTNDAAGAVTRLLDMNIEPFLVASSLECIIAQRLVRIICPHCRALAQPKGDVVRQIALEMDHAPHEITLYEGRGCSACNMTGYRGRTAIYEVLRVTPAIRELILGRTSSQQIKQQAMAEGMRTLRQDGLHKALSGVTTYSEVVRVAQSEEPLEG